MDNETLLTFTADIVSAHVSNNGVAAGELPQLIRSVFNALNGIDRPVVAAEPERVPAVSVRASVKADGITCLDCGVRMKMLKRHLGAAHGLTPEGYRERWGLPKTYPLTASDYSQQRQALARKIGLGRKPTTKPAPGKQVAKPATKAAAPRKARRPAAKAAE